MTEWKRATGYQLQRLFHDAFGHPVRDTPALPEPGKFGPAFSALVCVRQALNIVATGGNQSRRKLRLALLLEEVLEYVEAEAEGDLVGIADALADICVIAEGTALEYGIDLDACRREIHRANMSKLGADGKPIYRDDGKIMKGPGYEPPDLDSILIAAGWQGE